MRLQRRLYLQPTDDDPTHDEALSSRVAAPLNMHDLALEDLDVDVSRVEDDAAVKACGESEHFFLFYCFGYVLVYAGIYDLRIDLGVSFC
jgi:hypothetical protein